ncbi:hypothetical protein BDV10DRAFT_194009 [Aspergillus recurvatus]
MDRIMTLFVDPASRAADGRLPLSNTTVVRLPQTLAMKGRGNVLPGEAAVKRIAAGAGIRTPRVHRSWQVDDDTNCWDSLGDEQKLAVAKQVAGPIGGGPCRGRFFTQYTAGPFEDTAEMQNWFSHKLEIAKAWNKAPEDIPDFHLAKFVLTQDIMWLVDWADAGAYPRAFEAAAISSLSGFPDFNQLVLSLLP